MIIEVKNAEDGKKVYNSIIEMLKQVDVQYRVQDCWSTEAWFPSITIAPIMITIKGEDNEHR